MGLVKEILGEYVDYFKATFARCMFLMHALIVIWRTVVLLGSNYWFISIGVVCIIAEYFVTLIVRNGQEWNWISPATLCYLITALPGLWLQKLYHLGHYGTIASTSIATVPSTSLSLDFSAEDWMLLSEQTMMVTIILSRWLLPKGNEVSQLLLLYLSSSLSSDIIDFLSIFGFSKVAEDEAYCYVLLFWWTWSMMQFTLVLTSTRENDNNDNNNNSNNDNDTELNKDTSQENTTNSGNINVSSAENFEAGAKTSTDVDNAKTDTGRTTFSIEDDADCDKIDAEEGKGKKEGGGKTEGGMRSLRLREVLCSSELWAILVVFFLQDGPFLANRLVVMMYFKVFNYTIIFFICKNLLVLALQTYRAIVLFQESRAKVRESKAALKVRRYSTISLYSLRTISTIDDMDNNDDDDDGGDNRDGDDKREAKGTALKGFDDHLAGTSSEWRLPKVLDQAGSSGPLSSVPPLSSASVGDSGTSQEDIRRMPPSILRLSATRDKKERMPKLPAFFGKMRSQSETVNDQQTHEDTPAGFTGTSEDRSPKTASKFTGIVPRLTEDIPAGLTGTSEDRSPKTASRFIGVVPRLTISAEGQKSYEQSPFSPRRKVLRNQASTGDLPTVKEASFIDTSRSQDAGPRRTAVHKSFSAWLHNARSPSSEAFSRTLQQQKRKHTLEQFLRKSRHELLSGKGASSSDVLSRGADASTPPSSRHLVRVSEEGRKDPSTDRDMLDSAGASSRVPPFPSVSRNSDHNLP